MDLRIECKVVGRSRPVTPEWSVGIPPDWTAPGRRLTLQDLIELSVRVEVEAFLTRREQRWLMPVLTGEQIETGADRGKVAPGLSPDRREVDPDHAVEVALQAFTDGLYYVFLDDQQQNELDAEVSLRPRVD